MDFLAALPPRGVPAMIPTTFDSLAFHTLLILSLSFFASASARFLAFSDISSLDLLSGGEKRSIVGSNFSSSSSLLESSSSSSSSSPGGDQIVETLPRLLVDEVSAHDGRWAELGEKDGATCPLPRPFGDVKKQASWADTREHW